MAAPVAGRSRGLSSECAKQNSRRLLCASTLPRMSIHNSRRRSVRPIVAAVVQPVAKRLSRMEALLIEMRHEQDIQLRRSAALQDQLDTLTGSSLNDCTAVEPAKALTATENRAGTRSVRLRHLQ